MVYLWFALCKRSLIVGSCLEFCNNFIAIGNEAHIVRTESTKFKQKAAHGAVFKSLPTIPVYFRFIFLVRKETVIGFQNSFLSLTFL